MAVLGLHGDPRIESLSLAWTANVSTEMRLLLGSYSVQRECCFACIFLGRYCRRRCCRRLFVSRNIYHTWLHITSPYEKSTFMYLTTDFCQLHC